MSVPDTVAQLTFPLSRLRLIELAPLPADSSLARITVDYPERGSFLFVPNWCWILIVLSLPPFLLLKKRFGVEV